MSKRELDGWTETVGAQRPHRVTVFEHLGRDRVLYLRWRESVPGTARRRERLMSLERALLDGVSDHLTGRKRDAAVKAATEAAQAAAIKAAERQYNINTGVLVVEASPVAPEPSAGPLTLAETEAVLTHSDLGRFPPDAADESGHAANTIRALRHAVTIWGGATRWCDVKYDHWQTLWRTRMRELSAAGHVGYAGAKKTVVRVNEVLTWLIEHEHLPADTRGPRQRWGKDFDVDYAQIVGKGEIPTPERPRYSLAEMLALLAVAWRVDPRLALALAIGAENRNGQVLRTRRSQVALPPVDWTLGGAELLAQDFGTVDVSGRGKKGGAVIDLTPGQRRALDFVLGYQAAGLGYLRDLEAAYQARELADYCLFVSAHLKHRRQEPDAIGRWVVAVVDTYGCSFVAQPALALEPLSDTAMRTWLRAAEDAVRPEPIPHIDGRGFYGFRRQAVDAAYDEGISTEGIQAQGGWATRQMAEEVYRSRQEEKHRREARDVRVRFRREAPSPAFPHASNGDTDESPNAARIARTAHEQGADHDTATPLLLGEHDA